MACAPVYSAGTTPETMKDGGTPSNGAADMNDENGNIDSSRTRRTGDSLSSIHDRQRGRRISDERPRLYRRGTRLCYVRDVQRLAELAERDAETEDREDVERADRLPEPGEGRNGLKQVAVEFDDGSDDEGHGGGGPEEKRVSQTLSSASSSSMLAMDAPRSMNMANVGVQAGREEEGHMSLMHTLFPHRTMV